MPYKYYYTNKVTGQKVVTHREMENENFEMTGKLELPETRNTSVTQEDSKVNVYKKPIKLSKPKIVRVKRK